MTNYARGWRGTIPPNNDLGTILSLTWQPVMVSRVDDLNRNVGVTAELDDKTIQFLIKAKISPLGDKRAVAYTSKKTRSAKVRVGDLWYTQPYLNNGLTYRVSGIDGEDILLDES